MGIEQMAQAHSSENKGQMYTCAICKMGYVYKIIMPNSQNNVRLACEN